jgi:allene oxide cyclase
MWTMLLKGGQITVEGPFMDEGDSLFAVTGGTGKYAGAKGSMLLHARDAKPSSYDFTFTILCNGLYRTRTACARGRISRR